MMTSQRVTTMYISKMQVERFASARFLLPGHIYVCCCAARVTSVHIVWWSLSFGDRCRLCDRCRLVIAVVCVVAVVW